ncbi:hypothetical protein Bca52824_025465 [Brassica carinata]|uniref:HMG box domain-containing protein n=1 Tax=Brassica carinata TaxID=52824 RepID=A0A8X7V883_BRACI|nr:hypothetical protein Bca52824_025465 [Brassica carinata]
MSTVSPSSQLVQVVPDSHNNTGDSSAKVKYEDVVLNLLQKHGSISKLSLIPLLICTDEPQIGSVVDGVIDGEFEGGYLVTMKFGSQVLKGVLYLSAKRPRCQPQETMGTPPSVMPPASQRPAKKKARVTTVVDPQKPKCYKSGYNFFFPELYARLKPEYHGKEMIITKMIGPMWGNLYESEKQVYQDKGVKDVERYRTEMLEYKSAHEAGASASAAAATVTQ